jgi:hypothetical protein
MVLVDLVDATKTREPMLHKAWQVKVTFMGDVRGEPDKTIRTIR